MKLIVGLGNPGPEYNFTRHNFGFLALDFYFKKMGMEWQKPEKHSAIWQKQGNTLFIKPQTFYNEVGNSVLAFKNFYKIDNSNILILCDDFCIPFGTIRERAKGSAGGNNGLKSIISCLGTEEFSRLRLGTGNDTLRQKYGDTNFVLGKFTEEEKSALPDILSKAEELINKFLN